VRLRERMYVRAGGAHVRVRATLPGSLLLIEDERLVARGPAQLHTSVMHTERFAVS
jgi:hypothetical protein